MNICAFKKKSQKFAQKNEIFLWAEWAIGSGGAIGAGGAKGSEGAIGAEGAEGLEGRRRIRGFYIYIVRWLGHHMGIGYMALWGLEQNVGWMDGLLRLPRC